MSTSSNLSTAHFTLYGGVGVIGGTKVHLVAGRDEVLFDLGIVFAPGAGIYGGTLQPRAGLEAHDYVAMGVAPPVAGLYRDSVKLPEKLLLQSAGNSKSVPVFLTHLHLDHAGLLDLLSPEVPVYLSEPSWKLLQILMNVGDGPRRDLDYRALSFGSTISIGNVHVTGYAVDHDIPGATGYLAETPAGNIAYTGDFRGHGAHPGLTEAFFTQLSKRNLGQLLIEGTTLGDDGTSPVLPEPQVGPTVTAYLQSAPSMAFVNFYPLNVERIGALAHAAAVTGRRLALSPKSYYIYQQWFGEDLRIGLGKLAPVLYWTGQDRYLKRERPLPFYEEIEPVQKVDNEEIREDQTGYLVELPYERLTELVSIAPPPGSIYIHAGGTPLGPFDPLYANLERWLSRFGLYLVPVRSAGHASIHYLKEVITRVDPKVLYPIHTTHPARMPLPVTGVRILPVEGMPYRLLG